MSVATSEPNGYDEARLKQHSNALNTHEYLCQQATLARSIQELAEINSALYTRAIIY
jgi:hypothetical protein